MFASVSWQTTNFLTALVNLLQCSRRKDTASSSSLLSQKRAACQGVRKKHASSNLGDSDDTQKSTDISSSDPITGDASTDGSDLDSPNSLKNTGKGANKTFVAVRPPPGLGICPPPGLEAPPGLEDIESCPTLGTNRSSSGARRNSNAKVFTPSAGDRQSRSQRIRESIHLLTEGPSTQFPKRKPVKSVDHNSLGALRQAISKLSPQDAAVVRSFLHAKETGMEMTPDATNMRVQRGKVAEPFQRPLSGNQSAGLNTPWRSHPVGAKSTQRPFAPFQSERKPAPQQPPAEMDADADTLRTNLRDLAQLDSNRVILVRRINRLGLDSAATLEGYFSKFGTIDRLLVSHSRSKLTKGTSRVRPATVGFLVMSKVDEAQAVLSHGEEHVVQEATVTVSPFQSHTI